MVRRSVVALGVVILLCSVAVTAQQPSVAVEPGRLENVTKATFFRDASNEFVRVSESSFFGCHTLTERVRVHGDFNPIVLFANTNTPWALHVGASSIRARIFKQAEGCPVIEQLLNGIAEVDTLICVDWPASVVWNEGPMVFSIRYYNLRCLSLMTQKDLQGSFKSFSPEVLDIAFTEQFDGTGYLGISVANRVGADIRADEVPLDSVAWLWFLNQGQGSWPR